MALLSPCRLVALSPCRLVALPPCRLAALPLRLGVDYRLTLLRCHKIREADIANRIVVQQLRETFNVVSERIEASGEVSDQNRELLESWKCYDRQFLVSTRNHDAYMFLRSVTHLRIAKVNQLLRNEEEALQGFKAAIELQKQLIEESSEMTDCFLELVTSCVSAAASARSMGQTELDSVCLWKPCRSRETRAHRSREN